MIHITNELIFPCEVLLFLRMKGENGINSTFTKENCCPNNYSMIAEKEMWNIYCLVFKILGLWNLPLVLLHRALNRLTEAWKSTNFITLYRTQERNTRALWINVIMVVQLLSHIQLLQPHGLQSTRLLCPWDFPTGMMEWVAISFSRGYSQLRDQNQSPALQTDSLQTELPGKPLMSSYINISNSQHKLWSKKKMRRRKKMKERKSRGSDFNSPSTGHSAWIISISMHNNSIYLASWGKQAKEKRGNKNTASHSTSCVKTTGSKLPLPTHQSTGKQQRVTRICLIVKAVSKDQLNFTNQAHRKI